jgi:hypothetical protein
MDPKISQATRKSLWWIWISGPIALSLGMMSCVFGSLFPGETRAPDAFPDRDLVFIAQDNLGFMNEDGSNAEYVKFIVKVSGVTNDYWRPVMTADNSSLVVKAADYHYYEFDPHYLVVWHVGEDPLTCTQWEYQQTPLLTADQNQIFVQTDRGIALYNLSDCGTENRPLETYENLSGVPSPDLNYIAYTNSPSPIPSDDRFIIVHSIGTGEERTIGVGDYPAWSRDSQWLAYTGVDGIYITNVLEETEPRRVVLYTNPFDENDPTYAGGAYWEIPPEVSWSPDGKWLVYHRWEGTDYNTGVYPQYNSIYKLNVETGEEVKILDGGMYPSWRWPAEP